MRPLLADGFLALLEARADLVTESATARGRLPELQDSTSARRIIDTTAQKASGYAAVSLGYSGLLFGGGLEFSGSAWESFGRDPVEFPDWSFGSHFSVPIAAAAIFVDLDQLREFFPTRSGMRFQEQLGSMLYCLKGLSSPGASFVFQRSPACPHADLEMILRRLAVEYDLGFFADDMNIRLDWRTLENSSLASASGTTLPFYAQTAMSHSDWSAWLRRTLAETETTDESLSSRWALPKSGKSKPSKSCSPKPSILP